MKDNVNYFTSQIKNWKLKKALIITLFLLLIFPIPWIVAILLFIFLPSFYWLKTLFIIFPIIFTIGFILLAKYFFYKKYGISAKNINKLFDSKNEKFKEFFENQEENVDLDSNKDLELVEVEAKDPEADSKKSKK